MKKVIVITGPTGVGKTALSIAIAKKLEGEIINADATQVYRGLNIGSAKITEEEKENIPHHLLDIKNVEEEFSVRIKNGKFPGEADFYIKDGRIYQTEDDMMTPFVIEESDNYVTLKVFDGNDSTGLFIGAEKIKNN